MPYWITLKKAGQRHGFSAATALEAVAVLEAKQREGFEVRIIHPDGYVMSARALVSAAESRTVARTDVAEATVVS